MDAHINEHGDFITMGTSILKGTLTGNACACSIQSRDKFNHCHQNNQTEEHLTCETQEHLISLDK